MSFRVTTNASFRVPASPPATANIGPIAAPRSPDLASGLSTLVQSAFASGDLDTAADLLAVLDKRRTRHQSHDAAMDLRLDRHPARAPVARTFGAPR